MKLSEIKPNPKNPRLIKDEAFAKLKQSIKDFPEMLELRPIVVNEDMMILGGNMRYRALVDLGITEAPVTIAKGLSKEKQDEFIAKDNTAGGEWDWSLLANEWDMKKLEEWGLDIPKDFLDTEGEEDDFEMDSPVEPKAKLGDLYQLGDHKLLCGDSTKREDVEKLMGGEKADMVFTDPPYGVSIGSKNQFLNSVQKAGRCLENIENDTLKPDELYPILLSAFSNCKEVMNDCCAFYATAPQGGGLGLMMMMMMMRDAGLEIRHVLIWIKNRATFSVGRLDYDYQHEPIMFTWKKTHKKIMGGEHKTSCWFIDNPMESKLHPTMKPIILIVNALLNSSEKGDLVFDPFGGSGSTLIACEQTERKCRMMEIDPEYIDVIIARWEKYTGNKAILVSNNG